MKVPYIDQHKQEFGVQPICDALKDTDARIAPSTYYAAHARPQSARTTRYRELTEEIRVIHAGNYGVYGARKDARRGEFVDPRDGAISLKDYIATHWWPTQSGDPSTIERIEQRVRRHIVPHLGVQPLNAIGTEVLRHWKKRLEKDLGPTSIRLVWVTLSSVLQAAVEDRRLGTQPMPVQHGRASARGPWQG